MQICRKKKKKMVSTSKEQLKLDESDSESDDEFDKSQNICDGLFRWLQFVKCHCLILFW